MSTSSSSLNTPASRSPSPLTPEPSDSLDPVAIHTDLDIPASWYHHAMNHPKMALPSWNSSPTVYTAPHKSEEDAMLHLDDLIEQHAFEDSPSSTFNSTPNYPSPSTTYNTNPSSPVPHSEPVVPDFRASNLLVPSRHGPISLTKPIPPPASMPRKTDPSAANQRVVHPPKESCYNLPIMFPSIPEGGTKSRVETQVRVTVDLADSNGDPNKYDRVGSWKWLKLPQGTATKKRTRKQGKIDPEPQEILHLTATVTCSSPPHARVLSCTSCQAREAKRVAKKLAARVRPARSDSESDGDHSGKPHKPKHHEDTTSIIQFNCAEVLDFSTGSVVLPLRITCYCRHHREKVGFNVHLAMMDHTGRIIGSGMSRPIMITDDHKTATANKQPELLGGFSTPATDHRDWSQVATPVNDSPPTAPDARAPSRRKKDSVGSASALKKRPKPYDSTTKPNRLPREGSVSSAPSPSTSYSPLPMTRASTPSSSLQNTVQPEPEPPVGMAVNDSETSSPDTLATPLDNNSDVPMPQVTFELPDILQDLTQPLSQPHPTPAIPHSLSSSNMMTMQTIPHPMSFMFFDPNQNSQPLQLQLPTIHRLIPNMGPTHGGIEVTILGANFHPTLQLNCVFGDVAASSTQRWSDNTLVCILPPRAAPGVVAVWFDGFPKVDDQMQSPSSFFTYSDESDRALMELALQVVGLKMTGKIEDAKNVAMRIVGNTGPDGSDSSSNGNNGMMQLSMSPSVRALRPLLFVRACENDNYETRILDFLAVMETPMGHSAPSAISIAEAISYPSPSGQTLLHLAALLGFASLTSFLVRHGADVDARDRNGYTPLHFSALSKSSECATILLHAGADREIVNALGKTPEEIAIPQFFGAQSDTYDSESDDQRSEDEDADFGDGEEDEADVREIIIRRRNSRRSLRMQSNRSTPRRSANVSRAATPPPPPPPPPADEKKDLKAEDALDAADAKRAESFMEKMIQRTLAQIPAQGIIPNMPQLPLPNLPHLPDLPAVPWGALPQIPMVFPVFVPMMPGWPSFLGGEHGVPDNKAPVEGDETAPHMGAVALRAAQEWRATWEKWVALAVATTARQQTEELPPPVYTPRAHQSEGLQTIPEAEEAKEEEVQEPVASTSSSSSSRPHGSEIRPVGYDSTPVPDDVVESFGYQPNAKQTQKLQKKQDRMLVLFWLPILFVSMLWALHNGIRFAFHAVKLIIPAKVMRTV